MTKGRAKSTQHREKPTTFVRLVRRELELTKVALARLTAYSEKTIINVEDGRPVNDRTGRRITAKLNEVIAEHVKAGTWNLPAVTLRRSDLFNRIEGQDKLMAKDAGTNQDDEDEALASFLRSVADRPPG